MSICLLRHEHIRQWQDTGERPSCQFHHHISYRVAMQKIENDEAFPVRVDGESDTRAILIYDSVLRYTWQARRSDGFSILQFAPMAGRKSPLGLCAEARRASD